MTRGDGRFVPDPLASAIAKDFGSVDRWTTLAT